jgi:hypothetical protein
LINWVIDTVDRRSTGAVTNRGSDTRYRLLRTEFYVETFYGTTSDENKSSRNGAANGKFASSNRVRYASNLFIQIGSWSWSDGIVVAREFIAFWRYGCGYEAIIAEGSAARSPS